MAHVLRSVINSIFVLKNVMVAFFFGSFPLKRDKNDRDSLLWKKRKITMCWQEEGMKRKAQAAGRKEEVSLYHVIIGK